MDDHPGHETTFTLPAIPELFRNSRAERVQHLSRAIVTLERQIKVLSEEVIRETLPDEKTRLIRLVASLELARVAAASFTKPCEGQLLCRRR